MTRARQDRIMAHLARTADWVTAAELADAIGVTPRSVRSYVTALKARAQSHDIIESSSAGYRINADAYAAFRTGSPASDSGSPQDRLYTLVKALVDRSDGIDLYEMAATLHVSESTVEADLGRVRGMVTDADLALVRSGSRVTIDGGELARRKLLSRLFREESAHGMTELEAIQREFESENLGHFKTDLIARLEEHGYYINDYGMDNVLLHIAIAADRTSKNRAVTASDASRKSGGDRKLATILTSLALEHFDTPLGEEDIEYLAYLLATRAVAPGPGVEAPEAASEYIASNDLATVRDIVTKAAKEYLVDLSDEDFVSRLTMHVHNLLERANDQSFSRNPLTRSIKSAYPMIYELAVYIASELQTLRNVVINDDEIAYIAMHVGAYLQQQTRREDLVSCVIVCPNYYDMHVMLRDRVVQSLGDTLDVVRVITRSDVPWTTLDADIVLTTIAPPVPSETVVTIQPFFSPGDSDRVRTAVSRIRRIHRRAAIKDELLQYFDERLFLRNFHARDEESMIRALGERMLALGLIDEDYIRGTIERERMSSTAFTDTLAVPHAMAMTATRTSIAIAVNESSSPWGDGRVNVVALIAFSEDGRATFQTVFDQFVEVFSERDDVQRIVKKSVTFSAFIDELVHTMDS